MADTHNPNENIKRDSNYLRGTLKNSVADTMTGALAPDDAQLCKFHGFYEQDDRDVRAQRQQQMLEPYYSFMLRARLPGGVCTTQQWLAIDATTRELGNGSIRLTTRQTFQYHGILKHKLKPLIQRINQAMIDSIGGCGDVNRNVLCTPNPEASVLHSEASAWARRLSEHMLPKTRAYHEIWLDGKTVAGGESEPLYGDTYLPRKFKTAVAIPPCNDVDVYTNDLGFIAIASDDRLTGFNVVAGGGMGTTHDDPTTFPRLADTLGFILPEQVLAIAEAVLTTQRDFGDRVSRRHARLKYTIERMGLAAFTEQIVQRSGVSFQPAKPVTFTGHGDRYGWVSAGDDRWNLTLYIENGRVDDKPGAQLMTGLRELARLDPGEFRITPNQNLVVAGVAAARKREIETIARRYGLLKDQRTPTRLASLACVALPTCPQAMAEAERYFPALLAKVERLANAHGISEQAIVIRITGCPNGCARPFVAEIAFVGKGPGRYNLLLGGDGSGQRLARLYRKNIKEQALIDLLDGLFARYAAERKHNEGFGDFVTRSGIVQPVTTAIENYHECA